MKQTSVKKIVFCSIRLQLFPQKREKGMENVVFVFTVILASLVSCHVCLLHHMFGRTAFEKREYGKLPKMFRPKTTHKS